MKTKHSPLPPMVDPFELAGGQNPYLAYANLRAAGPLLRAGPGLWVIPRYQEISELLRDTRLAPFRFQEAQRLLKQASATSFPEGAANSFLDGSVVVANGPDHARIRKVITQSLLQRLTPKLRSRIEELTRSLLESAADVGKIEVISELAYPLPLIVLSELFGIPDAQRDRVGREVLKLSKLFSTVVTTLDKSDADQSVVSLRHFIGSLFDQRLESPVDDVISDLAVATMDGTLSRQEAIDNTIFLIFAGLETSMSLLATGCLALANHPEQMGKLRDNPTCVSTAIEEFLRYDAPTQITARTVRSPLEVTGRKLSKGRVLLLLLGSANHDECQFRDPDKLDVQRSPNPHVSFGSGARYCLGAGLAKMESEVVFSQLAQKFSVLEPGGDVVREPCATPRIYSRMPIRVKAV